MAGQAEAQQIDYLQIPLKFILPKSQNQEPEFKFQIPGRQEIAPITGATRKTSRKPSRKSRKSENQNSELNDLISKYLDLIDDDTTKDDYDKYASSREDLDELIKSVEGNATELLNNKIFEYKLINEILEARYAPAANN